MLIDRNGFCKYCECEAVCESLAIELLNHFGANLTVIFLATEKKLHNMRIFKEDF